MVPVLVGVLMDVLVGVLAGVLVLTDKVVDCDQYA